MMHNEEIAARKVGLADMLAEAKRELVLRKAVYPGLIDRKKLTEDRAQWQLRVMEQMIKFFEWAVPRAPSLRLHDEMTGSLLDMVSVHQAWRNQLAADGEFDDPLADAAKRAAELIERAGDSFKLATKGVSTDAEGQ